MTERKTLHIVVGTLEPEGTLLALSDQIIALLEKVPTEYHNQVMVTDTGNETGCLFSFDVSYERPWTEQDEADWKTYLKLKERFGSELPA